MADQSEIFSDSNDPNIPDEIDVNTPICYAYNQVQGTSSVGSFTAEKEGNSYYAISCLHVFGSSYDIGKANSNSNHQIRDKKVVFRIGSATFEGDITEYKFGNIQGIGSDYCKCKITKEAYDAYNNLIDEQRLVPSNQQEMLLFGARSKYSVKFGQGMSDVECTINYGSFQKTMNLYRIIPWSSNVQKGDSGSVIYYKLPNNETIYRGMIVSKSNTYAYMFRLS